MAKKIQTDLSPTMMGVYLGSRDADLLQWEQDCRKRGEKPTVIAKEAIRAYLTRKEEGQKEREDTPLSQVLGVLLTHEQLLRSILSLLQGNRTESSGVSSPSSPQTSGSGLGSGSDSELDPGASFVKECRALSWGV